jgi:hypothetical protein
MTPPNDPSGAVSRQLKFQLAGYATNQGRTYVMLVGRRIGVEAKILSIAHTFS